jgi:Tfp pilus assembly protein PilF
MVVRPRDAVQWALYYPPVIYAPTEETLVKDDSSGPRFLTHRASFLLSVGRVDEAKADIEQALKLSPNYSESFALQSIIAVVQNQKEKALDLSEKAVQLDPKSATARIALSYAQQAGFDLEGARENLEAAVKMEPENALAWARLAELWSSFGELDKSLTAAKKAAALDPHLSRTQTVLGFANLTQVMTTESKDSFEKAIDLDQAAPLPRLGLGLAKIREGNLKEGRAEIEIAVSLNPNNSLFRSYLGKAYYEEKRTNLDGREYAVAKELDSRDPTPWFYDAIRKQTLNRPVEALQDLQKSIELNDNRAVYRSRMLLDEDLAARSASLARIYSDLGFQQLALVEGWKSVNTDPANYSAHRFLADSYSALPRHEIARTSELLQSQLLQPINLNPIQPQLAESNLAILEGAGPSDPSFNEFNPLFQRNRVALQANGVVGGNDTLGDDLVFSGVYGKGSFSIGQFHYETDGFRENNDQEKDIYNLFAQTSLSPKASIQVEFRSSETEKGDLPLRFDPDNFIPTLRQDERIDSVRLGFHHSFTPHSDLISSIIYSNGDFDTQATVDFAFGPLVVQQHVDIATDEDGYLAEVQHLFHTKRFHVISGIGHFDDDSKDILTLTYQPEVPPFFVNDSSIESTRTHHTNLYVYSLINYPKNVTFTIGSSADFFEQEIMDRDQINPKLGLTWTPLPDTTLRAAVFRALKRMLLSNQTIEPTQVAGFNQFFDDGNGTDSWRYGIAIDQNFSTAVYGGLEFSLRDMEVPFRDPTLGEQVQKTDWEEKLGRVYLYWTPHPWLSASGEFQYERLEREPEFVGEGLFTEVKTYRFPLGINFFHPSGLSAGLKATYVDQEGNFGNPLIAILPGDDQFWVVDASIKYRLPNRRGFIIFGAKNLLDEKFSFQDTDTGNPVIFPERLLFAKITLAF